MPKTKVFLPSRHDRRKPSGPGSLASCHAFLAGGGQHVSDAGGRRHAARRDRVVRDSCASQYHRVFRAHARPSSERYTYNDASVERVRQEKKMLLTEHAGFSDFFVPVGREESGEAILVTGPFALRRPTSTDVLERWRWLTGRQGHPADSGICSLPIGDPCHSDPAGRDAAHLSAISRVLRAAHRSSRRRAPDCGGSNAAEGQARARTLVGADVGSGAEHDRRTVRIGSG